jgi:diguanylate cyclase (GGDEF)-like protein
VQGVLGILFVVASLLLMSDLRTALALTVMHGTLAHAYYNRMPRQLPYLIVGYTVLNVNLLTSHDPAHTARAIIVSMMLTVLIAILAGSQARLRRVVNLTQRLSLTDPLTGTANQRELRRRTEKEVARAEHGDGTTGLALFTLDLDNFKEVNDTISHTMGDSVLKAVADAITEQLEPTDLACRRGGDEFSVLVLVTPGRDMDELKTRIATAIERARVEACPSINPTASVDYILRRPGEIADDLFRRGDDALHEAKRRAHAKRADDGVRKLTPVVAASDHSFAHDLDEIEADLDVVRWTRQSLGTHLPWNHLVLTCILVGLAMFAAAMTGLSHDLRDTQSLASIAALLPLAAACRWAGGRGLAERYLHLGLLAILITITATIVSADYSRSALVDLYMLLVLIGIYCVGWRWALPHTIASAGLFVWFLVDSASYPAWHAFNVFSVTTATALMLIVSRKQILGFTERCMHMSELDALTGIANLRILRERVAAEIDRCNLTGHRLALLALDLDDFKSVNDRYSHTVGDQVLIEVAKAMSGVVRSDELVARRGGDEFAAVCVPEDEEAVIAVAKRMSDAIEAVRLSICPDIDPRASIGWVMWQPGESMDAFLARADLELHTAKVHAHAVAGRA